MTTRSHKPSRTPRPKRTPVTLAPPIGVDEALNAALAWWDEYDVLSDLDLGDTLEQVISTAHDHDLRTVRDLHTGAAQVTAAMAGVTSISQFADAATADRLHLSGNGIAAIVLATQALHGADPHGPYDLIDAMPYVAPRHGDKCRPASDDEVLLTRSATIHSLMRGGRHIRVANQYALAESAAHPIETTTVRPCDFDTLEAPTSVLLRGDTWYRTRRVALTNFARRVLAHGLDAHLAANPGAHQSRLCFDGTNKASASASSSNNLKHLAERVGITSPALEGSYATRWRVHKELRDAGAMAALYLVGKNHAQDPRKDEPRRVYEFLNLPPEAVVIEVEEEDDDEDLRNFG